MASAVAAPPILNGDTAPITSTSTRWHYLQTILSTPGSSVPIEQHEALDPSAPSREKILVIGAGGLGCEILKNLALSGSKDIHVIDMDTIDVSNLNRQFLFRQADVGKPKAEVAARFVERRVKGVGITPFVGKIQDKDEEYYKQFNTVVCGLDSIEARRWINKMLIDIAADEEEGKLIPLIDGGTEGFKGQARVILPTMTSCIECQLDMHAPRAAVPLCTIATIPRQPQHCVEWAHQIAWPAERKDDTLDTDDPAHISWLFDRAATRAKEFKIEGVTYALTQGVVKNIIPAIASTNAIIAAACCNEASKLSTGVNPILGQPMEGAENYMMYTGDEGVYGYTFSHQKKDDCPACGNLARTMDFQRGKTLQEFLDSLSEYPAAQLKNPSITTGTSNLYFRAPPALEEQTRPNLKRKLDEMVEDGDEVNVTDPAFTTAFKFKLAFRD